MKTLFIMNGVSYASSGRPSISGGDVILIEIARRWSQNGVEVHFLTSPAGKELCKELGLKATYHLSSRYSNSSIRDLLLRTSCLALSVKFLEKANFDLLYSSCEHLYDVLPAFRMKRNSNDVKWVAMIHFLPPLPWHRMRAGKLRALLYYLNHALGAYLIRSCADLIFAVSRKTALDYVSKLKFDETKVVTIYGGVHYSLIRAVTNSSHEKMYDAIFMKRLQPMKGAFAVIEVWRHVVNARPDSKLLIVGDGPADVVTQMRQMITKFRLVENIDMIGPVYDVKEKILLLARSKLFLLPSYEENWAIVIGEALTAGLPVIAYDLPEIRSVWGKHVIWISKNETRSFAEEVVKLLSNEKYYQRYAGREPKFLKQCDWDNIAEKELELCTKLTVFK